VAAAPVNSDRDRILEATDLVGLIGEQVRLLPKGSEFIGLCPFHEDARPSMYVVPAKGFYHCFACGAHGNAIDFLIGLHGMEFIEALESLASRAGLELSRRASNAGEADRRRQMTRANHLAAKFFSRTLSEDAGKAARAALAERGIDDAAIERFGIGAAPDSWDGLVNRIHSARESLPAAEQDSVPSPAIFEAARLISAKRNGGHCDFFRNRVVFPIRDELGRPIAFGARRINPQDEPKYINSPETEVFSKGSTLFGIDLAAKAIGRTGTAIICEGYTDVIALHMAGFENAVATLGTALTREHAQRLGRRCERIVLLFDGDTAGKRAADRAVEVFFGAPVDVRLCSLPDGLDPDDLLRQADGPARFKHAIDNASDAFMSMLDSFKAELDGADGITSRARVVERTLSRLASLGVDGLSGVRRKFVLSAIADSLGFSPDELSRIAMPNHPRAKGADPSDAPRESTPEPMIRAPRARRLAEEGILGLLLADRSLLPSDQLDRLSEDAFIDPPCAEIWTVLRAHIAENTSTSTPDLIAKIGSDEASKIAASLFVDCLRTIEQPDPPAVLFANAMAAFAASVDRSARRAECSEATSKPLHDAADAARALETIRKAGGDPASIPRSKRPDPPRGSSS
jgi:DNA primase